MGYEEILGYKGGWDTRKPRTQGSQKYKEAWNNKFERRLCCMFGKFALEMMKFIAGNLLVGNNINVNSSHRL